MVDPIVNVSIVEYRSRPVSVTGAVKQPLTFQAFGTVTLLDAIARAEGLTDDAGPDILVTRTAEPGLTRRIPIKALLSNTDPALNVTLQGDEEVRVPDAGKVYIVGNIKKPGAFKLQQAGETSVLRMLALSEGLQSYSSDIAYIYRRDAAGNREEIPVELRKITQRKISDVSLKAEDVFYIPDNKGKRLTMTALDRIASFGAVTGSGVLIWH